jgi:hypothetical protein
LLGRQSAIAQAKEGVRVEVHEPTRSGLNDEMNRLAAVRIFTGRRRAVFCGFLNRRQCKSKPDVGWMHTNKTNNFKSNFCFPGMACGRPECSRPKVSS